VIENIDPVNAPSCYRISLLSSSLEVTARLKCVDDLDLLMNVLESNRAFFVKNESRIANGEGACFLRRNHLAVMPGPGVEGRQ
jgi:hypothetical protein